MHSSNRLTTPLRKQFGTQVTSDWQRAYADVVDAIRGVSGGAAGTATVTAKATTSSRGKSLALLVSPMLTCEEAFALGRMAQQFDPACVLGMGPIPMQGTDKTFPAGIVAGASVFVCDNLSFSGEVKFARKHTRYINRDLPQLTERAIGLLLAKWHDQDKRGSCNNRGEDHKEDTHRAKRSTREKGNGLPLG